MGRYSTVQAFADNNPNMRKVAYDQAAGASSIAEPGTGGKSSGKAVVPEKVVNPYGSTAGAGSGEFHVYRHARSREMMRVQQLDEEEFERKADEEFRKKVKADQEIELKKTEQRRKKRQREKEARMKKKVMKLNGLIIKRDESNEESNSKFEDEFEYTPMCSSPHVNSLVPNKSTPTDLASPDQIEQPL